MQNWLQEEAERKREETRQLVDAAEVPEEEKESMHILYFPINPLLPAFIILAM